MRISLSMVVESIVSSILSVLSQSSFLYAKCAGTTGVKKCTALLNWLILWVNVVTCSFCVCFCLWHVFQLSETELKDTIVRYVIQTRAEQLTPWWSHTHYANIQNISPLYVCMHSVHTYIHRSLCYWCPCRISLWHHTSLSEDLFLGQVMWLPCDNHVITHVMM